VKFRTKHKLFFRDRRIFDKKRQRALLLMQRPAYVFAYQRRSVIEARSQCLNDRLGEWRIPQADSQVAQPLLMSDAPNRTSGKPCLKLLSAPSEQLDQRRAIQAVSHGKIIFIGNCRKFVPGADKLAIIAAIYPITDQRPQELGNTALMFDSKIRNTTSRIQPIGRYDRLRRADI